MMLIPRASASFGVLNATDSFSIFTSPASLSCTPHKTLISVDFLALFPPLMHALHLYLLLNSHRAIPCFRRMLYRCPSFLQKGSLAGCPLLLFPFPIII